MIIVGFSGHRPNKIGGFSIPNPTYNYICQQTEKLLLEIKPDKCISGMAIGYDQYAAIICIRLNIPVIAAIPFKGQESKWNQSQKNIYHKLLSKTSEKVIVSEGEFTIEKMQIRNQYIVDNCDILIACYDGSASGTRNCIQYAKIKNKKIIYINPKI